ncbi:MAG: helix-turn-helix domain-containing protein [Mycobacteriales bacterium]
MGYRHPNPRLIKLNRSYNVDEISRVLRVHKNTVRNWMKQGLSLIDDRRPALILGPALREFLEMRRAKAKRPCPPGYLYCVACHGPKRPALGMVDYLPLTATAGNLRGICPDCNRFIHRRVSVAKLDDEKAHLDVRFTQPRPRIGESASPTVSCDLDGKG